MLATRAIKCNWNHAARKDASKILWPLEGEKKWLPTRITHIIWARRGETKMPAMPNIIIRLNYVPFIKPSLHATFSKFMPKFTTFFFYKVKPTYLFLPACKPIIITLRQIKCIYICDLFLGITYIMPRKRSHFFATINVASVGHCFAYKPTNT